MAAEAGLPPIRLHGLRNGAGTFLLAAGYDMEVVQETLRLSSITIAADTYTSLLPQLAGVARDADGALTVVGLDQNALLAAVVPTMTKRAVIGHLSGLQMGEEISFRIRFEGPTGEVLAANVGQAKLEGEPPWADQNVETAFDVPVEVQIPIQERGRHRFVVTGQLHGRAYWARGLAVRGRAAAAAGPEQRQQL